MAAASLPLEEFDEKFLTCAVCEDIYTDPRVLPCLHTFCARCLEKWRKGESQFNCPTCPEQVRLQGTGVSSLPPYYFMNSLLDFRALHDSEEAHTKCQMCKSEAKVDGRCADCSLLLCKNCITVHSNISALKDHYIITLDDLKNPSVRPKYTRAPYCPQHTDQRVTFYCQPCAKLVCRDCTITEHRPGNGSNHDAQEVSEVAQKYKAGLETLVAETKDAGDVLQKTKETVGRELTTITENCQTIRKEIEKHFADMRAKLDEEEKKTKEKLDKMEKDQKEPLVTKEKDLEEKIKTTEEGLKFSTDILDRGNDVEILTLRQQLKDRLNVLSSIHIQHEALENKISFQSDALYTDLSHCYLFLSEETLFITETPIESLPTTVIFRPQKGQVCKTNPEVTVTSPGGQCVKLDTARASGGAFKAVWRPQTSGKHVVSVTGGGGGGWGELLSLWSRCSPLTVDVNSNNPSLCTFGKKGSQQGQFNTPIDLAVRGDKLYVADTFNKRVQVFDPAGNFCYSFTTTTNPVSIAVNTDGTIVAMSAGDEVERFTPSGELLHSFPLGEYCTDPYGLAVQRDGRVVVADKGKHSIFMFEADGTLVKQIGGQGQGEGQFNKPCFVCVDKEDNIIVADKDNDRIQVFDNNLNFHHKFGQWDRQPQDMFYPMGVSADSSGNIVLTNIGEDSDVGGVEHGKKLQVFRPDGTWVSTISSDGEKLKKPHGVAVTEDGHVFVADPMDHCIRKYRYM
ncbi:PREDICTED: E3 ubiquitin-protein ligase TRIM71-like [Branchiostoma belcheri]|uniref:RING-type E3 ubiquitin transferase n=1 Tax=Branchiostoma belcheri TaxID=7741 RepID=A0A6P4Z5I7_BRABE|nr:PREDICTED: E3 ubiquitin-protein ligase TRIM71-like [Branchiostoma belcheri]